MRDGKPRLLEEKDLELLWARCGDLRNSCFQDGIRTIEG